MRVQSVDVAVRVHDRDPAILGEFAERGREAVGLVEQADERFEGENAARGRPRVHEFHASMQDGEGFAGERLRALLATRPIEQGFLDALPVANPGVHEWTRIRRRRRPTS